MEFDKIETILPQRNINTTAAHENVAEIGRHIRVIKERCQGILSTLPFKIISNITVIRLLKCVTMWLNASSVKSGVSSQLSRKLINRHKLDAK